MKYIVITGGVMSGLGKGVTAASIGRNLKTRGISVAAIKIDPYINIDAGTMSPFQHGEIFVLKDGGEVDLDLGNYERFLDIELTRDNNLTTGMVYQSVISKERRGEYLGKTVQIIPHITNEIKNRIRTVAEKSGAAVCLIEVGGTVGDIEGMPFLEAMRQMQMEEKKEDIAFVHVTLVPLDVQKDQKTKPTQHSIKDLRELGISVDAIVTRCEEPLNNDSKSKISLFCDIPICAIISASTVDDIYEVPQMLEANGFIDYLMQILKLESIGKRDDTWDNMVSKMKDRKGEVKLAIVGKYTNLEDAYLSIVEAIKHASIEVGCNVDISWLNSEEFALNPEKVRILSKYDGVLVPGGFGERGIEGKILAIKYVRENNLPYLGLCLGMQLAVIEFARTVLELEDANSLEFDRNARHKVIDILPEQKKIVDMGATMRLGDYEVELRDGTMARKIYDKQTIIERHRHRYEVNPKYLKDLESHGMIFSGRNNNRMEIIEIPDKKFFFASQFHPEFKSRPGKPSPPFRAFVEAMNKNYLCK